MTADRPRYIRLAFAPKFGLVGLRVGRRYFKVKAPWCVALFSERYGYEATLFRLGGWRLVCRQLGR